MAADALCQAALLCRGLDEAKELRTFGIVCRLPLLSAVMLKLSFEDASDDGVSTAGATAAAGADVPSVSQERIDRRADKIKRLAKEDRRDKRPMNPSLS